VEAPYHSTLPNGTRISVDPLRNYNNFLHVDTGDAMLRLSLFTAGELYSVLASYFESPDPVDVCTMSEDEPIRIVRGEAA
jgi:hypothetical protein